MTRQQAKENIANNSELYKWSLDYFDSELKKVRAENAKLQEKGDYFNQADSLLDVMEFTEAHLSVLLVV